MTTLYEVGVEGLELNALLTESDGELTPETEARLEAFLKSGKEKIDAACMVVRSLDTSADACIEEAKRLNERASSFLKDRDRLKSRILGAVDAAFDGKVKTNLFTVNGQTSAPTVRYEVSPDADLEQINSIYPELVRRKFELDKTTCKSMVAQGIELPSVVTAVHSEGKRYLRIR